MPKKQKAKTEDNIVPLRDGVLAPKSGACSVGLEFDYQDGCLIFVGSKGEVTRLPLPQAED